MSLFFSVSEFDNQLARVLNLVYTQGADIGEVFFSARKIREPDFDSWYSVWHSLAKENFDQGILSLKKAENISARAYFAKASTYFRQSVFFFLGNSEKAGIVRENYRLSYDAFEEFLVGGAPFTPIFSNYNDSFFEGKILIGNNNEKSPLIIYLGGYDTSIPENYFLFGKAALARGYNYLLLDGPGQGLSLVEKNIHLDSDWNLFFGTLFKELKKNPLIDSGRIIVIGQGLGSSLASKLAALYPEEIKNIILIPGIWDPLETIKSFIPDLENFLKNNDAQQINTLFTGALKNKFLASRLQTKMWVMGASSPAELFHLQKEFQMEKFASSIRCNTLIIDHQDEPYLEDQTAKIQKNIVGKVDVILISCLKGASRHSAWGGLSNLQNMVFDWIGSQIEF